MDLKFRLDAHLPASEQLPAHEIVDHRATPTAPVCLCLPAMGASASYYRPFAQALARALAGTVVLADLRGQGESEVRASRGARFGYREIVEQDVPALLDTLAARFRYGPLFVIGHSLGGQLATLSALHRQDRLAGLVLVAAGTARIVLFRRPIVVRAPTRPEVNAIVRAVLIERVAELLGIEPEEVDPRYES